MKKYLFLILTLLLCASFFACDNDEEKIIACFPVEEITDLDDYVSRVIDNEEAYISALAEKDPSYADDIIFPIPKITVKDYKFYCGDFGGIPSFRFVPQSHNLNEDNHQGGISVAIYPADVSFEKYVTNKKLTIENGLAFSEKDRAYYCEIGGRCVYIYFHDGAPSISSVEELSSYFTFEYYPLKISVSEKNSQN